MLAPLRRAALLAALPLAAPALADTGVAPGGLTVQPAPSTTVIAPGTTAPGTTVVQTQPGGPTVVTGPAGTTIFTEMPKSDVTYRRKAVADAMSDSTLWIAPAAPPAAVPARPDPTPPVRTITWTNPETGSTGVITPISTFQEGDLTCREWTEAYVRQGQSMTRTRRSCSNDPDRIEAWTERD